MINTKSTAREFISGIELQDKILPPIEWLVEDLLPTGLSILCAPSKMGKSWMMLQMSIAIAEGKPFLGFTTRKSDVMYYALEDTTRRLQSRQNSMLLDELPPENLYFRVNAHRLDDGLLKDMESDLTSVPTIKLFIIDTFQKIRGKMQGGEAGYSYDYREMGLLKNFCDEKNVAIILVHHTRKQKDDDDFNRVSGTVGIMGAADSTYILTKQKRSAKNALLKMTGRDIMQSELEVYFDENDYNWKTVTPIAETKKAQLLEDFKNSPTMLTVRGLVAFAPCQWEGTLEELKAKTEAEFGVLPFFTTRKVMREIHKFKDLLKDLYGIEYAYHRTEKSRLHRFYKNPAQLVITEPSEDDIF